MGEPQQGRIIKKNCISFHYIIRSTAQVLLFIAAKEGDNYNISVCITAVCSPAVARHRVMRGGI